MCVEGRRRISWSGLTQDIKMGSYVIQCDVPHKWIAATDWPPCMYTVPDWGVMPCVCGTVFLCHSILVKVSPLQAVTIVICPQMFKSDVKPLTNKQKRDVLARFRCSRVRPVRSHGKRKSNRFGYTRLGLNTALWFSLGFSFTLSVYTQNRVKKLKGRRMSPLRRDKTNGN